MERCRTSEDRGSGSRTAKYNRAARAVRPAPFEIAPVASPSDAARPRLRSLPHEPLFIADWDRALMIHYEVDRDALQRVLPFELDLIEGRAFVTLVAFTLRNMRPRFGGAWLAWLLKPIATHNFLNVRTYVRCGDESGIYFLAEWLAKRLSVMLGPTAFGLPYRYGRIEYRHDHENGMLSGRVNDPAGKAFEYRATLDNSAAVPCAAGSMLELLMERYTAFTCINGKRRFFRVWHEPWQQQSANVHVQNRELIDSTWDFFRDAEMIGASYSAGVRDVWMGWPHPIRKLTQSLLREGKGDELVP